MKPVIEKAKKVLEVFPSFHALMNDHAAYEMDKILFKKELKEYSKSQEWEGVALAADKISSYMNGHVFWNKYDFDEKGNGTAVIVDHQRENHEVDFHAFLALITLFYISSINMKINQEQYLAWSAFTEDDKMRKFLE